MTDRNAIAVSLRSNKNDKHITNKSKHGRYIMVVRIKVIIAPVGVNSVNRIGSIVKIKINRTIGRTEYCIKNERNIDDQYSRKVTPVSLSCDLHFDLII